MLTCKGIKKLNIIKMIWKFQSYQVSKIFFWFCIRLKWTFTFYFVIFYLSHKCLNRIGAHWGCGFRSEKTEKSLPDYMERRNCLMWSTLL